MNKTQVMASPETGEITANNAGDSTELQGFDRWLFDRFPAARMAWLRSSSLKLRISTKLARNGGRKWENRPVKVAGLGRIRVKLGSTLTLSLSHYLSLSLSIYMGGQKWVWGITLDYFEFNDTLYLIYSLFHLTLLEWW